MDRRIFIRGEPGFIGSTLTDRLVEGSYITVLDYLSTRSICPDSA